MKTTIAKRIQSRLSRKGVKVSLGEIKPIYNQLVADDENPTNEEQAAIFDHLMNAAPINGNRRTAPTRRH